MSGGFKHDVDYDMTNEDNDDGGGCSDYEEEKQSPAYNYSIDREE